MKKIYSVLSVLLTIILMGVFVSCERDKEVMLTAVSITNEQITPTYKSATISSTISSEATIRDVFVQYTVTKDFAEYDEVPMQEKDGIFTAELIDLLDNTTYYYRYAASNRHSAIVLQKIQQFATLQPSAPAIRLDSILTVWDSYAQVQVALEFDGGASVTDMGVCWGTQANPTIEDIHKSTKDTVAVLDIPSLQPNTQYYVRAYAVNKVGVAYSEELVFTTYALPEVRTEEIADIQVNTVLLSATLVSNGNDTTTIKGFCWSEKSEPTIEGDHIAVDTICAHYTYVLSELLPATEYHVRAYAQNKIGVAYGEEKIFTTSKETVSPTVTTAAITQITETTAVAGGDVTSDGGASVTERGVVYATTQNPTTNNIKVKSGTGTGSFTCNLTGLQANTTYYVRAYAMNEKGTAYGEEVTFITNKQIVLPSVTTAAITQITETGAVAGGVVTSDGGASVTERGVVYATTQNPTTADNKVSNGSGTGSFTCNLTDLQPNTTYYVRAYATNEVGTAYGEEMSFTTETPAVHEYVDLGLSVKWAACNVGASKPEEYGDYFAWGETTTKDTYSWSTYKYCNGSEDSLTKYNTSSSYGTVDNKKQLEVSDDAARVNWGGSWRMPTDAEWTELRGQCTWTWTTQNGVNGYKVTSKSNGNSIFLPAAGYRGGSSSGGAGRGGDYWSSSLETGSPDGARGVNFDSSNVYRAGFYRYGGQSVRPVWGEYVMEETVPTIITTTVTQITETTAVAGGNVTSDGGASVTERGVCISTVSNPTISNIKITAGSGTGSFTCNLTGLQANTTYYVRAYAVNNKGTAYGEEVTFTTLVPIVLPTLTTSSVTQITETSAVAGGHVTSDGNASVTDRGVVYSTNQHPTAADNKVSNGSGMGSFTCNLTNLQPNTKYYVRAYAVNSQGTAYGEEVSFTTEKEVVALPEYVDLGLSVKWASFNVGATKPEEYGDYFAWGEVEPKSEYSWSTYKWCNGYETALIKYNTDEWYGMVDNKTIIESEDDAATENWGNDWRLPNKYEIDELRDKCTWNWINRNGTYGYQVTGPSGKSIFLPATRYMDGVEQSAVSTYGSYWSSSLYTSITAWHLGFYSDYGNTYADKRYTGRAVRPVYGSRMDVPKITTSAITQITETTAVAGGNVTSDGGASVTERGVVYAITQNPTTNNTKVTSGTGTGLFTCNLSDLQPNTTYYVRAYAKNDAGTAYGEEVSFTTSEMIVIINPSGSENGHDYVDLGLPSGIMWATMNLGAETPEAYGDYFAWGETVSKNEFTDDNYKFKGLTKYTGFDLHEGTISYGDGRLILEPEDDAAFVNWGGAWRMPTIEELEELCGQCEWIWCTMNGINGYNVKSKINNRSIFLPAAGEKRPSITELNNRGYYRSSSLSEGNPNQVYSLLFSSLELSRLISYRTYGESIRPVFGKNKIQVLHPTLKTIAVTEIRDTIALVGGHILNDGGSTIIERGVIYSSENGLIITQVVNGVDNDVYSCYLTQLQPNKTYYVRAYARNSTYTGYGEVVSFTTKELSSTPNNGTENGYAYVDLGLSVKWATMNVGASSPEDYGDYFAWGETTTKDTYNWSTYKYCNGDYDLLTKYCNKSSYGNNGFTDNKTQLELSDDAARVNWGGSWRMPTDAEWTELREQCTWTWTTQNGKNGYKVTSKSNGNSIFLPAAGCRYDSSRNSAGINGNYWSSSLCTGIPYYAWSVYFYSGYVGRNYNGRYNGFSVRPVCP